MIAGETRTAGVTYDPALTYATNAEAAETVKHVQPLRGQHGWKNRNAAGRVPVLLAFDINLSAEGPSIASKAGEKARVFVAIVSC